jgi:polysaccharide biosynthesis protein PslG
MTREERIAAFRSWHNYFRWASLRAYSSLGVRGSTARFIQPERNMKAVFWQILPFQWDHNFWVGRSGQYKNAGRYNMAVAAVLLLALIIPVLSYAEDQNTSPAIRGADDPRDNSSPWGVASGAEWFSDYPRFNPLLRAAGVRWLRGFYEWQTIQPTRGYFSWAGTDRLVANAKANNIRLAYPLAYLAPWASADGGTRKFPMKDIQFWRDYVSGLVSRYHQDIKYWEVWNEFNGSFAENGTPAIYAELVRETSIAAKKIDPTAQIGISVANFDVNFLDAAIKAGAGGHFDYICVHPYEKLAALADNGEVDFLTMARTLRQMLAANNLPKDMPLWITEIGAQTPVSPEQQADTRQAIALAKAYLLSIASGFRRVFWFEARGPSYGNQTDHGLIRADFTLRPSFQALKNMIDLLGPEPTTVGWVKLGANGYGFVFSRGNQSLLAAWAPSNQSLEIKFDADVQISDLSGTKKSLPAGQTIVLTDAPQLIINPPRSLVQEAGANKDSLYLWGEDYAKADLVTVGLQVDNTENGLRQINVDTTLPVIIGDQAWRRTDFSKPGSEGHYIYFAVTPQFVPFGTSELEITAVVRRLEPTSVAGMSLDYESKSGYVNAGYLNIPQTGEWQELKWKIADANFVGQWGWHFRLNAIASPNEFSIKQVKVRKFISR